MLNNRSNIGIDMQDRIVKKKTAHFSNGKPAFNAGLVPKVPPSLPLKLIKNANMKL